MTSAATIETLLEGAVAAAQAAGNHALANRRRRREVVLAAEHDIKLRLDIECQRIAEALLRERFPDDAFLGEEDTGSTPSAPSDAARLWIVDPIDGTVNFTHGLPLWCCSVAVEVGGRSVAGAVFAPELGELYTATLDGSARLNGQTLAVSDAPRLSDAMVLTGLDRNLGLEAAPFSMLNAFATHAQKARVLGSAALDLCKVACGQADGYYENGVFPWDVAAGTLLVERAGGRAEILRRTPDRRLMVLATNGRIHDEAKRLIRRTVFGAGAQAVLIQAAPEVARAVVARGEP